MASVTQRVATVKQPKGGYLPMKLFRKEKFDDGNELTADENIHASLIGIAVDYLTRYMMGESAADAFHISYLGAINIGMQEKADFLISLVTGLDDISIDSACKLAGFDVCFRVSTSSYKPVEEIAPDEATIRNIRVMVSRTVEFWDSHGPVVCSEPTFEGGYTRVVSAGDGDFVTEDTLWDIKVLRSSPTTKHSLQLLMYYIMGQHSAHLYFKNLSKIGFFNPRINVAYICKISDIPQETITNVENDVICYGINTEVSKESGYREEGRISGDDVFAVADICRITRQKKTAVYADIRNGRLKANKKGNKYVIDEAECFNYVRKIKRQQRILTVMVLACLALVVAFLLFLMVR